MEELLCLCAERVEVPRHVVDAHGEQGRIGRLSEQIAPAQVGGSENTVRSGRRAPLLRRGRAEQDDRGPSEGRGKVGSARVGRYDKVGVGDERGIVEQARPARHDSHAAWGERPHSLGTGSLSLIPGQQNSLTLRSRMGGNRSKPIDGPMSAGIGGAGMDDDAARTSSEPRDIDIRHGQSKIGAVRRHTDVGEKTDPPVPLVHLLNPFGSVPSGRPVSDAQTRVQLIEQGVALGALPVEVDGDVDRTLEVERFKPRGRKNVVDTAGEARERSQPVRAGQDDPVLRERPPQPSERWDGHEQVSDLERPQNQHALHGPLLPDAVLFDRDNTLVVDVPYNGDPDLVVPMPGAREALDRLRALGIPLGVVTNQSGIALGRFTRAQADSVNARVEELLGPFQLWQMCPHEGGCECRKPRPGMLLRAADELRLDPASMVYVGDIGADMEAARAAGMRGILVPTPITRPEEIDAAQTVCSSLAEAVDLLIGSDDHDRHGLGVTS